MLRHRTECPRAARPRHLRLRPRLRIVARALSLGASCSGEHGAGIGKREILEQEHGSEALAVMRSVKQALDPRGILNPGKIFLNCFDTTNPVAPLHR
jgi:hypothetical protein